MLMGRKDITNPQLQPNITVQPNDRRTQDLLARIDRMDSI